MENRQQWGPATQIINRVIRDHHDRQMNTAEFIAGNSLPMQIAAALHAAGHITRSEMWVDRT